MNVRAPFFLIQRTLPLMRDGGRIINISSSVTRVAFPQLAYAMTKGALDWSALSRREASIPGKMRGYGTPEEILR